MPGAHKHLEGHNLQAADIVGAVGKHQVDRMAEVADRALVNHTVLADMTEEDILAQPQLAESVLHLAVACPANQGSVGSFHTDSDYPCDFFLLLDK